MTSITNSVAQTLTIRLLIKERINQIDGLSQLITFITNNFVHIIISKLLRYE